MKKLIKAATRTSDQLPITKLTEDELAGLPDKLTCFTEMIDYAGSAIPDRYRFKVIPKAAIHNNPSKCWIDDSGSFIAGDDIYLAAKSDVEAAESEKIDKIREKYRLLKRYAL